MNNQKTRIVYLTRIEQSAHKVALVQSLLEHPGEALTDGARQGAMLILEEVNAVLAELKKAF